MCGLKIAREVHRHSRDNLVDLAGYAHVLTNALKRMKPETCDLYRHYDKEWNLLYVGISLNAIKN